MYYEALPNPNKVDRLSDFGPILYDLVHIESGVVTLGSSALRSVFESAHPGQRCSLLSRKNFMYMFDRHASLYITASWSPGHSSGWQRGGRHLSEGLEASVCDKGLCLLSPQIPCTNEGPAAAEKAVSEGLPKVQRFRTQWRMSSPRQSLPTKSSEIPPGQSCSDRYSSRLQRRVLPTLRPDRIPLVHVYKRSH